MLRDGVQARRFGEPEEITDALAGVSCRVVPLGRGPFEAALTAVRMGDATLTTGRVSPCLGLLGTAPDHAALLLPLENAESLVLDAVACRPGMVGTYAGGAELLCANPRSTGFAALVLPSEAVERLLEPPAGSRLLQQGSSALLQARPASWGRATRIVRAAGETARTAPAVFDAEQPRGALRDALLEAANDLVSPDRQAEVPVPRSSRARRRLVAAADGYLRAHVDRPIYTEELCGALAVSASGLAEAFRSVFAVSPHRYLKLRRLGMVRVALRRREGPAPLVKSVALSHGFWHLGQFAHDYRETFGEAPSETLARTRPG